MHARVEQRMVAAIDLAGQYALNIRDSIREQNDLARGTFQNVHTGIGDLIRQSPGMHTAIQGDISEASARNAQRERPGLCHEIVAKMALLNGKSHGWRLVGRMGVEAEGG